MDQTYNNNFLFFSDQGIPISASVINDYFLLVCRSHPPLPLLSGDTGDNKQIF